MGIFPINSFQRAGKNNLRNIIYEYCKFINWLIPGRIVYDRRPITLHKLIRYPSKDNGVRGTQELIIMLMYFVICDPCRVVAIPVKGHVDCCNYFSHFLFLIGVLFSACPGPTTCRHKPAGGGDASLFGEPEKRFFPVKVGSVWDCIIGKIEYPKY